MSLQNTGTIGGEGFRFAKIRWLTNRSGWHSARDSIQAAEDATREQGEGIIELLPLIKDFFKLRKDLATSQ